MQHLENQGCYKLRKMVEWYKIPLSPHKQAQRLGQSSLLRFFFKAPVDFPEPANREAPDRSPKLHSPIPTPSPLRQPTPTTPLAFSRECTEQRSRGHKLAQENTKDPCNKTHSPAQQKALARMKKDTDRTFPKG